MKDQGMESKTGPRNPLEKFLSIFAPVKHGEAGSVLLLTLNVFLLLTAYYIIKPVREALIIAEQGAAVKTYASAGQALLLLFVVPLYSRLAGSMNRRRLITMVTLFFMGCLGAFYGLAEAKVPLGIPFFLWVGVFNVMVIAQFWSFANDVYTTEQGKRLFAIVGFGASMGAVAGSFVTDWLVDVVGIFPMLLISAGLLGAALVCTLVVDGRSNAQVEDKLDEEKSKEGNRFDEEGDRFDKGSNGFDLVFKNGYLLLIAAMMLLANLVNTTGEYILGARVEDGATQSTATLVVDPGLDDAAAAAERSSHENLFIAKFYNSFFKWVNIIGVVIQLLLVSRIVKWAGVPGAILILPIIALGAYAVMAIFPILAVTRWTKTAENSTDYSLQNTVRNMLFLPTTREEKYQAKQAIDSFCMRAGDVMAALLVFAGTSFLQLGAEGFAWMNVGLAGVWIVVVVAIGKRYRRLTA